MGRKANKKFKAELTMLRGRLLSLVNNREVTRGDVITTSSERHKEPQVTETQLFKKSKCGSQAVLCLTSIQVSKTPPRREILHCSALVASHRD